MNLFTTINQEGQTIVMVTHSVKAASSAKRVLFIKDGKVLHYKSKKEQSREAFRLGLENEGLPLHFPLKVKEPDLFGSSWHIPYFDPDECAECGSRIICNGCARCGKCKK